MAPGSCLVSTAKQTSTPFQPAGGAKVSSRKMPTGDALECVHSARAELARAVSQLKKTLAEVPDDRINWSPAPAARTPIQQVAHCAITVLSVMAWIRGEPFDFSEMSLIDAKWRQEESTFTTREAVQRLLDENVATYETWMSSLTAEQAASTIVTNIGEFKMADAITFNADHIRRHTSQIHYIQTCYGDLDYHL